jgi:hypothetical protein
LKPPRGLLKLHRCRVVLHRGRQQRRRGCRLSLGQQQAREVRIMPTTSDDDQFAADVSAVEADGPGPGGADPLQHHDRVRQRIDGAFRWAHSNAPAVTAGVVAALALLPRRRAAVQEEKGAGVGLRLSDSPKTYRVYATPGRSGRAHDANGHVITARDHFVALPPSASRAPHASCVRGRTVAFAVNRPYWGLTAFRISSPSPIGSRSSRRIAPPPG